MCVYNSISAYIISRNGCQVSFFCLSQPYFSEMASFTERRAHLSPPTAPVSWQSETPRDRPVSVSVEVTETCNDGQLLLSVMGIELMSSCLLSSGDMKSCTARHGHI